MNLVTPYEPASSQRDHSPRDGAITSRHAVRETRWVRLEMAAASARGRRRHVNQDWHSAFSGSASLFVVADGVGGGAMPAQASRELVSRLHAALDGRRIDAPAIRDALLRADREVGRSISNVTGASGAATVALCAGTGVLLSRWLIAWVGDCRIYRVGTGRDPAQALTIDDTYRHLGEMPPPGGSYDDPARMIGNGAVSEPNVERVALHRGDMLVICSDGVHKHVEPQELSRVLHGPEPLVRRCGRLLALARARGSKDDATVLVVRREPRQTRLASLAAAGMLLAALILTLMVVLP